VGVVSHGALISLEWLKKAAVWLIQQAAITAHHYSRRTERRTSMFTKFFAAVLTFSILAANPVFCAD
jgi:hypothetical protein